MSHRTPLFIDKLSFTYAVEPSDRDMVLEEANELANAGIVHRKPPFGDVLKNYRHAFGYVFGGDEQLLIQLDPRSSTLRIGERLVQKRFMRLEWNPTKALSANRHATTNVFDLLGRMSRRITPESVLLGMNITRVDLAFDIIGERLENIGVSGLSRRAYSGRYEYSPFGRVNEVHIGRRENSGFLRVYDKLQEKRFRGAAESEVSAYIKRGALMRRRPAHSRFELELHKVGSVTSLASMRNPFAKFNVRTLSAIGSGLSGHVEAWMLSAIREKGMQAALSLVENRRERKKYLDSINACEPPNWWDADAIWNQLGNALITALRPN